MPLEIRELVIKAQVDQGSGSPSPGSGSRASSAPVDQQAIIQAVVEQVLAILKEKAER